MRWVAALTLAAAGCAAAAGPAPPVLVTPTVLDRSAVQPDAGAAPPNQASSPVAALGLPTKDAPLWEREFVHSASVRGRELETVGMLSCALEVLDPATGSVLRQVPLPREMLGAAIECSCTAGAGLVGCTKRSRELTIVDSADGRARWTETPSHEDLSWQVVATTRGLVALETPWRRIGPRPSSRLIVFDATNGKRSSHALDDAGGR